MMIKLTEEPKICCISVLSSSIVDDHHFYGTGLQGETGIFIQSYHILHIFET